MWENIQENSLYGYFSKFTSILEVPGLQVGSSKNLFNSLFPPFSYFKNSSTSSLLNPIVGAGSRNILENVEGDKEMGWWPCISIILRLETNLSAHHWMISFISITSVTHHANVILEVQIRFTFFSAGGIFL